MRTTQSLVVRLVVSAGLSATILAGSWAGGGAHAEALAPTVVQAHRVLTTRSLDEMSDEARRRGPSAETENEAREAAENPPLPWARHPVDLNEADGALQTDELRIAGEALVVPTPLANFAGLADEDNAGGSDPPDTNGDIGFDPDTGKKYYMQSVNTVFSIWDVTTPSAPIQVLPPTAQNAFWADLGGPCAQGNDGDGIVLFDALARRWFFSQFALPNYPVGPYFQCIAVSTSADPLGTYFAYEFEYDDFLLNDYPKFGVWPDAYYMTVNQFGSLSFHGVGAMAFERDKMLAGAAARVVYFDVGALDDATGGMLPSDADGLRPPNLNTPNYFLEFNAGEFGDASDALRIWEFHVDWNNPSSSTFGTGGVPTQTMTTAAFDPVICTASRGACIPQPAAAGGQLLEGLADRLMHRLVFRQSASFSTLLLNHTVDAGSGRAGVRWYELRKTAATWAFRQQATFAPAGTTHRWLGSIAMDGRGDIALGYSASSSTLAPAVRYSIHDANDPNNVMDANEVTLEPGGGVSSDAARWGDYSAMQVDPADDCTFWFTNEFFAPGDTSGFDWRTKIGAFRHPSCTTPTTGTVSGTVTAADSSAPIAGAFVQIGAFSALTDANGTYSIPGVLPGTFSTVTNAHGFAQHTQSLNVAAGGNTFDVALDRVALALLDGFVTDSDTGLPVYAALEISAFGGFHTNAFSDPQTGAYFVILAADTDYEIRVTALVPGYEAVEETVTVAAAGTTHDFALADDDESCTSFGHQFKGVRERFESLETPTNWTVTDNVYGTDGDPIYAWNFEDPVFGNYTGGTGGNATADPFYMYYFTYYYYGFPGAQVMDTELITPQLNMTGVTAPKVRFKQAFVPTFLTMYGDVDVSVNGGANWTTARTQDVFDGNLDGAVSVNIPGAANQANVKVRFHFVGYASYSSSASTYYYDLWEVDDAQVGACVADTNAGEVVGIVVDANTGQGIVNAAVSDGNGNTVRTSATPSDPDLPDGVFILPSTKGLRTVSASKSDYSTESSQVTVVAGQAVFRVFTLKAGRLNVPSPNINVTLNDGIQSETSLTLANLGTQSLDFLLTEVNAPAPSAERTVAPPRSQTTRVHSEVDSVASVLHSLLERRRRTSAARPVAAEKHERVGHSKERAEERKARREAREAARLHPPDVQAVRREVTRLTRRVWNRVLRQHPDWRKLPKGERQAEMRRALSALRAERPQQSFQSLLTRKPRSARGPEGGFFFTPLVTNDGLGFNTDATDLWVSDPALFGGDDLNHRFLPDSTDTGDSMATDAASDGEPADMAYNPLTDTVWQIHLGGDNCVHELDPTLLAPTGRTICPSFSTPQVGLAYDVVTDTFWSTGFADGTVARFQSDGTILSEQFGAFQGTPIPGTSAAYNPASQLLYVMEFNLNPFVLVFDASDPTLPLVGVFELTDDQGIPIVLPGAGLDFDCDGKLWATDFFFGVLFDASGDSGVCDATQDVPWLDVPIPTGSIVVNGSEAPTVTFDTTGLAAGQYTAHLRVFSNTPYVRPNVPVNLTVITHAVALSGSNADSGTPGSDVIYTVGVKNNGSEPDTFALGTGGHAWATSLPLSVGPIDPGNSENIEVTVHVPEIAGSGDSDVASITATSLGDPTKNGQQDLTTTALTSYAVTVTPGTNVKVTPGAAVTYTLTVTNTGNAPDTFTIGLSGNVFPSVPSANNTGSLNAGATKSFNVTVTVPAAQAGGTMDTATVTVTSQGNGAVNATASLTTMVSSVFAGTLAPQTDTKSANPGQQVVHTFSVKNTGNAPDRFDLSLSGSVWASALNKAQTVLLNPNASDSVTVTVTVSAAAKGGDVDAAVLTAKSVGNVNRTDAAAVVTSAKYVFLPSLAATPSSKDGEPGKTVSYTVTVRNSGNTHDSFTLGVTGNQWTTGLTKMTVGPLASGASENVTVNVSIPHGTPAQTSDTAQISARSGGNTAEVVNLSLKTTAVVLVSTIDERSRVALVFGLGALGLVMAFVRRRRRRPSPSV